MIGEEHGGLPPVGHAARLHVDGRSVPVTVLRLLDDGAVLEVVEDGRQITGGEARLAYSEPEGGGLVSGAVEARDDGRLLFLARPIGPDRPRRRAPRPAASSPAPEDRPPGRDVAEEIGQRRDAFRVDVVTEVTLVSGLRERPAMTINVSNTGCLLRCDPPLREGERLIVVLSMDGGTLELRAEVLRVAMAAGTALRFVDMDATEERRLGHYLAERQRQLLRRR